VLFLLANHGVGVDISALNAVYMRNVPPTPANYAQRSGRAGRSGQGALALTYCSAQGPHDQYFFRDPKEMVHGEVRSARCWIWRTATWWRATCRPCGWHVARIPLRRRFPELLVLQDPTRPLRPDVRGPLAEPRVAHEAKERIKRVLDFLADDLTPVLAPWFPGRDEYAAAVADGALARFEEAFDRWRDLFSAAEQQRDGCSAHDGRLRRPPEREARL